MKRRVPKTLAAKPRPPTRDWAELSSSARALLAAFAVHPGDLAAEWLVRIAPEPAAVDELTEAGWIVEREDGRWGLRDESGRAPLSRLIPWALRQAQHRALAGLGRSLGGGAVAEARHWQRAGDDAPAFSAWLRACAETGDGGVVSSLDCLDEARRLVASDSGRAELLARAVERAAENREAGDSLRERLARWLEEAEDGARPVLVGTLAPLFAGLLATCGEHVAGAEWRVRAARALEETGDAGAASRQLTAATTTFVYALQYSAARETATDAVALARRAADVAAEVEAASALGLLLGMKGEIAAGRASLERALDLALEHRLASAAAEAYRMLGTVAEYASCYRDEQAAFARAIAYCRRHDEMTTAELCLGCMAYSLFRSGNWSRARAVIAEVLGKKSAHPVSRFVAGGVLGLWHAHRGELREAASWLEGTIVGARETGIYAMEFFGRWGLALVEEQAGQAAASALHYRKLLEFWRASEDRHDAIPGLTGGGLFFAARGERAQALEFRAALRRVARETANPEAIGAAALVTGELEWRAGRAAPARVALEAALAAFASRDLVIERVRVLTRLAPVLRALGDEAAARQAGAEAGRRARRWGARALLGGEEEVAVAGRASPSVAARDPWSGLSPRQRDTARQLCGGLTNKEIAARLGLSVRTVDMHVADVLKRLGCRTRAEAAAKITVMLA